MVYTNSRATIKLWYPHTKKLKYWLSAKFDEHNNNFGKGWSPGSNILKGKYTSAIPTIKIDLSDHPCIECDIF